MDKLKMQSGNLVQDNVDRISKLFPQCVSEGKDEKGNVIKLVDFDLLKQELSSDIVEGGDERYTLNWAGKKQAILTANAPINATLRPNKDGSINFEDTKNLYIESDNLDALKLLRETYLKKIKMIYIDPPYNTGNDFVYEDDFAVSVVDYLKDSKSYDEQGNKLFQNNDSNGRFHSDWLSMMYSRLKLAKDFLTDDGIIFISIDENEVDNLKKICDEIFGESSHIGNFIWENRTTPNDADNMFAMTNEYIVMYAKNNSSLMFKGIEKSLDNYKNPDNDPNGPWIRDNPSAASGNPDKDRFIITNPYTGEEYLPPKGRFWGFSQKRVEEWTKSGKLVFSKEKGKGLVLKKYLSELKNMNQPLGSIIQGILTMHGTKEMKELFPDDDRVFKYPKPTELIKFFIDQVNDKDMIIMDFFSGSATTAHAVMRMNAEDGGNRRFILVQVPEVCAEGSEAQRAGYKTICEIGKERIRRAGNKVLKENPNAKIDIGFRDLKLDSSNMKDVYYNPAEVSQDLLSKFEDNIKEDRTTEDLLFQVMLDMGVDLSSDIKVDNKLGKKIYNVNDGNLVCCFDKNLSSEVVTEIAKMQPLYAVFRDSSMISDSMNVNLEQIFETYSPTTKRKVL